MKSKSCTITHYTRIVPFWGRENLIKIGSCRVSKQKIFCQRTAKYVMRVIGESVEINVIAGTIRVFFVTNKPRKDTLNSTTENDIN